MRLLLLSSIAILMTCLLNLGMPAKNDKLILYSAISGSIGLVLSSIRCCYIYINEYSASNNTEINVSDVHPIHTENFICEVFVDETNHTHPALAIAIYTKQDSHIEESINYDDINKLPVATNIQNV